MNLGHSIDAVRADDGQVRHPHLAARSFLYQAQTLPSLVIAGVALLHVVQQAAVDFIDDL